MKTLYIDCQWGVAGDMLLGALVDAGAPFAPIKRSLEQGLGLQGIRLGRRRIMRAGVGGLRIHVRTDEQGQPHRHLRHVLEILDRAELPDPVRRRAGEAFRELARAEAKVHRSTIEKIHFHEVGCLDAIADVTGVMLALEALGIEHVAVSPVTTGSGHVECRHGRMPVPAPATAEILAGLPSRAGDQAWEMATPTGAALLKTLADQTGSQPLMQVEALGYGAGKREIPGQANYLRVLVGQADPDHPDPQAAPQPPEGLATERVWRLACDVDDMPGEQLGALLEDLFQAGCLDALLLPLQMKKNRPGHRIEVLCDTARREALALVLLRQSSSLGLRVEAVERWTLPRRIENVTTPLGKLRVKIAELPGGARKIAPEYESCRELARRKGLPLAEVYRAAQAAALDPPPTRRRKKPS